MSGKHKRILVGVVVILGLIGVGGIAIGTRKHDERELAILDPNTTDQTLVYLDEMVSQWNGLREQSRPTQPNEKGK